VPRPSRRYVALVSAWDHEWDVYVLDPSAGLVGVTHAVTLRGVRQATRDLLSGRSDGRAGHVEITVVHGGRSPRAG
jgi:hypothetical protein